MGPTESPMHGARFADYVAALLQAVDAEADGPHDVTSARRQFDDLGRLNGRLAAAASPADWRAALLSSTPAPGDPQAKKRWQNAAAELPDSPEERERTGQQLRAAHARVASRLRRLYADALTALLLDGGQIPAIPAVYGALRDWLPRAKAAGADAELLRLLSLPGRPPADALQRLLVDIRGADMFVAVAVSAINGLVRPAPTSLPAEAGVQSMAYAAPYVLMSDVVACIGSSAHTHTSHVAITGTLIVDDDYAGGDATGKNLILLAGALDLSRGHHVIDVSGRPGLDAPSQPAAAADRDAGREAGQGSPGQPATVSGDVILCSGSTTGDGALTLRANGAEGGAGQPGGAGADGKEGQHSANADLSSPRLHLYDTLIKNSVPGFRYNGDYSAYLYEAKEGGPAGAGGAGGKGGNSGQGSCNGLVCRLGGARAAIEQVAGLAGRRGAGGPGGAAGRPGRGGHHGVELFSSFSHKDLVQDGAPDYWCRRYFKNVWYEQQSAHYPDTLQANSPQSHFGLPWAIVQKSLALIPEGLRAKVMLDHAADGQPGRAGDEGHPGKLGGDEDEDRPLKNPHALDPARSLANFVAQLLALDKFRPFVLQSSGVFDPATLTPSFLYALLAELQRREAAVADPQDDLVVMAWTKPVYRRILDAIHARPDGFEVDGQVLRFFLDQKLAYVEERLAGGGVCGNQVVDLVAVNRRLGTQLDAARQFSDDERRRMAHEDFAARIDHQMQSGRNQVRVLGTQIDDLLAQSGKDIDRLLEQIAQARADEKTYAADLVKQEQQLQQDLEHHVAFAVLGALVSVAETVAGTGAVFSQIGQQLERTVGQKAQTDVSVQELHDKIRSDQDVIQAAHEFKAQKFQPLPHMSVDVPLALQQHALEALDYDEIHRSTGETEERVKAFIGDYRRLDAEKTAVYVALHDKEDLPYADFQRAEQQAAQIDARIDELLEKNEHLPQVLYTLRNAEIEQLRREQTVATDLKKSQALEQYAALLQKERDDFETQKVIKGFQKIVETGSVVYNGVVKVLDTKKEGEAKIAAVDQALKASGDKVMALETLHKGVIDYRRDTLNASILPLVAGMQSEFGRKSVFENLASRLDLKRQVRGWTAQVRKCFGTMAASADIAATFERVEEVLEAQLQIWDGIAAQQERKEFGTLAYRLSAPETAAWTPERRAWVEATKLLQIKHLSELERNAFLLFAFPDGYADLEGAGRRIGVADGLPEAMAKALAQNHAIGEWLATDASMLERSDKTREFQNLTYGTLAVDGSSSFARRLLTGERVTLDLAPREDLDVVKYISFYAHIPCGRIGKLRKDLNARSLLVDVELFGPAAFACHTPAGVRHVYEFGQDPVGISHSIELVNVGRAQPIGAFSENRVSKKFGLQKLDSGRSPYCHVALQIDLDNRFRIADVGATLREQFAAVFPFDEFDERLGRIVKDLQRIGWLDDTGAIARWSRIEDSTALAPLGYPRAQARWIEQALFEQANIFGLATLPSFPLEFVGYGFYTRKGRASVPTEYEVFRSVPPRPTGLPEGSDSAAATAIRA